MSPNKKIIAVIAGLSAALLPLAFMQHFHIAENISKHYLGEVKNFGTLSKYAGQSSYDKLKGVMFVIALYFVLYMIVYMLCMEFIAVIYYFASSKYKKPKVFISYKNTAADAVVDTGKIAEELKKQLEKNGFEVLRFPYSPTMHHDEVNHKIRALIIKSNAVVVVPDPYNPSYVDSEIQMAVGEKKTVFLIRHTKDERLPNTANSGHGVFIWSKLKKNKFDALNYLLLYTHNYWTTHTYILGAGLEVVLKPFAYLTDDDAVSYKAIGIFALATAALIYFNVSVTVVFYIVQALVILMGILAGYSITAGIFKRLKEQTIASQATPGELSAYKIFEQAGIDKKYMASMDPKGLAIGH